MPWHFLAITPADILSIRLFVRVSMSKKHSLQGSPEKPSNPDFYGQNLMPER
jgi:hypothetical protein